MGWHRLAGYCLLRVSGKSHRIPAIVLPERLESTLIAGHPWVFREQVPRHFKASTGSWVRLTCGKFSGLGLWDASSPIALRVYSRSEAIDPSWWQQRVSEAWQLREAVRAGNTNAFRWLHGEADGVPGLVVDYYAGYAVLVCDGPAARRLLPALQSALVLVAERAGTPLVGIVERHRDQAAGMRLELLHGVMPPEELIVVECGLNFRANLHSGQKTGLFLDQRENRRQLANYCAGKRVLNLFSYNGGFSVHAANAGAAQVTSVDIAKAAAVDAAENFRINGFDPAGHEFVADDVFEYLEQARQKKRQFDVVICDPPSFARKQEQLKKALAAYCRVNAAGMKVVVDGGLYAASSCTARVTPKAFLDVLSTSARRAQRRYQIIEEHGHAADHPVLVAHPEGRYLKFMLGRLLPRA